MRTRGSGYRGETPRSSCWFILAPVCCGPCVAPVPAVARDRPTAHLSVTQLDHNLCYQRNSMRDSRFQSISSCGQRYPRSTAGADGHTCIVSQPLPRQSHPVIAGALDQYCCPCPIKLSCRTSVSSGATTILDGEFHNRSVNLSQMMSSTTAAKFGRVIDGSHLRHAHPVMDNALVGTWPCPPAPTSSVAWARERHPHRCDHRPRLI
jgi:hypothetical protein